MYIRTVNSIEPIAAKETSLREGCIEPMEQMLKSRGKNLRSSLNDSVRLPIPRMKRIVLEKESSLLRTKSRFGSTTKSGAFFSILRISILSLFLTILQYFCTENSSNQMYISDWLRRTFSAFCQYLFAKIYSNFTNKQPPDLFKSCGCS